MKKIITVLFLSTCLGIAGDAIAYIGPDDERLAPGIIANPITLGWLAQRAEIIAVADIFEDVGIVPEYEYEDRWEGFFKVRVVNHIYGCTNNQEILVLKRNTKRPWDSTDFYDPLFEYYPTNNSRILFAGTIPRGLWGPNGWNFPPYMEHPVLAMSDTNNLCLIQRSTRSWWYEANQDELSFTHLTNLLHAARVEPNWTNFYHIVRDAVPTPASPRVWQDSFEDLITLAKQATREQYEYMENDPLLPAEFRARLEFEGRRFNK